MRFPWQRQQRQTPSESVWVDPSDPFAGAMLPTSTPIVDRSSVDFALERARIDVRAGDEALGRGEAGLRISEAAGVFETHGKVDEAEKAHRLAISYGVRLAPKAFGEFLERQGRPKEAAATYEAGAHAVPTLWFDAAAAHEALGNGKAAAAALRKAAEAGLTNTDTDLSNIAPAGNPLGTGGAELFDSGAGNPGQPGTATKYTGNWLF
jgi:hypothetical protein